MMIDEPTNNRSRGQEVKKQDNRTIKRLFIGGCILAIFGVVVPDSVTNAIVATMLSPFGGSKIGSGNGGLIIIELIALAMVSVALFFKMIMHTSKAPTLVNDRQLEGELPLQLAMKYETFRTKDDNYLSNEEKMVDAIEDWLQSSGVFIGNESDKKVLIELKYLSEKGMQYSMGVDLTLFLKVAIYVDDIEATSSVLEVTELRPEGTWARFNHGMTETFNRLNEKLFIKSVDIIEQWVKAELAKV